MRKSAWKLALRGLLVVRPATLFSVLYGFGWYGGSLRKWVDQLNLPQGAHVLEIGCGPGKLSAYLAGSGYQVSGVDRSAQMIAVAQRSVKGVAFSTADAFNLPFADNSFDAVIAASLLNVVPDRAGLLAEMARVTRKTGVVSVLVPTEGFTPETAAGFAAKNRLNSLENAAISLWAGAARKLDRAAAEELLETAGLGPVSSQGYLGDLLVSVRGENNR